MMIYQSLKKEFLDNIRNAMMSYQKTYSDRQKEIPKHRAKNIAEIDEIISSKDNDVEMIKELLAQTIANFKTGWWILKTGRSTLKTALELVMNDPQYENEEFLKAKIIALEQALKNRASPPLTATLCINSAEPQFEIDDMSEDKILDDKKPQDDNTDSRVAELVTEIKELKNTIVQLEKDKKDLLKANDKMAKKIQEYHQAMQVNSHELSSLPAYASVLSTSPSDELYQSFSSLTK